MPLRGVCDPRQLTGLNKSMRRTSFTDVLACSVAKPELELPGGGVSLSLKAVSRPTAVGDSVVSTFMGRRD